MSISETFDASIFIPSEKRDISITRDEGQFLHDFIRSKNFKKTLEIGFAFGYSTAYIMDASKSAHVVIDPYQQKLWENIGLKNIEKLGLKNKLTHLSDPSHLALPLMVKEGKKFEFIFIDGSHKFDNILVDFYFSDLLLENKGYLFFHDNWMKSTKVVCQFIRSNRKNYVELKESPIVIFKKIGIDDRAWDHFEDFYPNF